MAALTEDKVRDVLGPSGEAGYVGAAANAVGYVGSLIVRNAAGYGAVATSAAGVEVLGTCTKAFNNTGGANGDIDIEYEEGQVEGFAAPTLAITDVGLDAKMLDDATLGGTADSATALVAGRIVAYRNSKAYCRVGRFRGVTAP